MPTLPLYTPNAIPDASHRVLGPGGYEWWHFDATSSTDALTVVARLGAGFLYHREYRQRYEDFLRRPTSNRPPVPAEYPCVEFAVWREGRRLARCAAHFPADQYFASEREPNVRVGASQFDRDPAGQLRLRLRAPAGEGSAGSSSVDLDFRPLLQHTPCGVSLDARALAVPRHHWTLADGLSEVTGRIVCDGNADGIEFRGAGHHSQAYGTEPLGVRPATWVRGRILLERRVIAFQLADGANPQQSAGAWLVDVDASGARLLQTTEARSAWPAGRMNGAPEEVRLRTTDGEIRLFESRPLDHALASTWVSYRAAIGTWEGRALCEVVDDPRKGRA
jgi:hypothetical protein